MQGVSELCVVIAWLIITGVLLLLVTWILAAPLVLQIDTRVPIAQFRWISIGSFRLWYDEGWRIGFQIFFFRKTFLVTEGKKKEKKPKRKKAHKAGRPRQLLPKILRVLRSFRVDAWELALDTGDHARNAKLYPLNFAPALRNHLLINFNGDSYLFLRIRNRVGRMVWAYLR